MIATATSTQHLPPRGFLSRSRHRTRSPSLVRALPAIRISVSKSPGVLLTSGGLGSYSYSWSGDESLSGIASSIVKSYTSAGIKNATVTVTDTHGGTGSAACTTGPNQPNGPVSVDTGGLGVSVGACTASLTANPDQVIQGDSTSLTWSVTGGSVCASSCTGSGFTTGAQSLV